MAPRQPDATVTFRVVALAAGLLVAAAIAVALPRPSDAQPETELGGNAVDVSGPRGPEHTPDPIAPSDAEDRGTNVVPTPDDGLSKLPKATPYPTPSTAGATDVRSGIELLRGVPGVNAALAAVESGDGSALVSLMERKPLNCAALGRFRPTNCETRAGTDENGNFESVVFAIMDLGVAQATPGIEAALRAKPHLIFATRDASRGAEQTVYHLVFESEPYEFTGLGITMDGVFGRFALTVWARDEAPVTRFAPGGPGGSPLQFVQQQANPGLQELILPQSLEGFRALGQRD